MSSWNQLSWVRACLELVIGAAIATLLYLATMSLAVSKSLLFSSDAKRIIEIHKFCSTREVAPHKDAIFIIGSSIAVEGIDADVLDKSLAARAVTYNLGVVGLTPVEALMLEPALALGKPQIAVIGIDLMSLGVDAMELNKESIDFEKLQTHRAANALTKMGSQVKKELLENLLLPDEKAVIEANYLSYLIGCRSLPIFFTESKFRAMVRKGLRTEGITTNFKSPWMLSYTLTGNPKERILSSTGEKARRLSFDENNRQVKALRTLVRALRAQEIALMISLWPVHPRISSSFSADLINRVNATLNEIAQENNCIYRSYSGLLVDSEFADALHPNFEGRAKLSSQLALDLKSFYSHPSVVKNDDLQ